MRINQRVIDKSKNSLPVYNFKLVSSLPEFGSMYSMYNSKDVHHGLNGEEWLLGARPLPFWGLE